MRAVRLRLPDFALEAQLTPAGERTYDQAQVDAIRRQAFAEGEAHGRAAAVASAEALQAEHAAALRRLAGDVAEIRDEADELMQRALRRLESILAGVVVRVMSEAVATWLADNLRRELQQALATLRLPEVELTASPATLALLQVGDQPLSSAVRLTTCGEVPFGEVRLAWCHGGATVQPGRILQEMQAALVPVLEDLPAVNPGAELATDFVHRSDRHE